MRWQRAGMAGIRGNAVRGGLHVRCSQRERERWTMGG